MTDRVLGQVALLYYIKLESWLNLFNCSTWIEDYKNARKVNPQYFGVNV